MSSTLTNELAKQLKLTLKLLLYAKDTIYFPRAGEELKLLANSVDKRYSFNFVINRKVIHPNQPELKTTLLTLYKNVSLMRIDIAGPEHQNPVNAILKYPDLKPIVYCPHIHIFDEEFNIAYPLPIEEYGEINTVTDLFRVFLEFMNQNNIANWGDYKCKYNLY